MEVGPESGQNSTGSGQGDMSTSSDLEVFLVQMIHKTADLSLFASHIAPLESDSAAGTVQVHGRLERSRGFVCCQHLCSVRPSCSRISMQRERRAWLYTLQKEMQACGSLLWRSVLVQALP